MAGANGDWQAHAIDTARAVSRMKPAYIAFLTLRVYSGTPLIFVIFSDVKLPHGRHLRCLLYTSRCV